MLKKSRIYEISCQRYSDAVYYGLPIRNIEKRFNEHMYEYKNRIQEKSSVEKHLKANNHSIDISHIKLVEEVTTTDNSKLLKLLRSEKADTRI